jgi:hypothetical protein
MVFWPNRGGLYLTEFSATHLPKLKEAGPNVRFSRVFPRFSTIFSRTFKNT